MKNVEKFENEQDPPHNNLWQSEPSLPLTGKLILE
jgi:hypothetical protein